MAKKEEEKKSKTEKPKVKKEAKSIVYDANKMYSFEANGNGKYNFVKGKIYSVNGRTANELIRKKLGKIK
jgi:hypothetical protein